MDEPVGAPQPLKATSTPGMWQTQEIIMWLADILRDQTKRKALLELRGHHAQSLIDGLNYYVLDKQFREAAEPWLVKHTVIALRKLCEVSALYPTCYVLGGIENISAKSGGGFCDISQGRYRGQLICLKIVRLYQDSNIKQLLKAHAREAILWGQLDHPNIVPFYGIFYLDRKERICLVSPWMEKGDIVEYLRRVPESPRKRLVGDIASGLQYLHTENIVHGDLKGRNILIDEHGKACIADFGLSTILTNETLNFPRTTVGTSGWTMRWASPELLEDHARPTRASDVWAFGCVCIEVLTGVEPFAGCSDYGVFGKLIRGELPARLDNAGIDETLCALMARCWSIEVDQRPECSEILQELGLSGYNPQQADLGPSSSQFMAPDSTTNLTRSRMSMILEQIYLGHNVDSVQAIVELMWMQQPERRPSPVRDSGHLFGPAPSIPLHIRSDPPVHQDWRGFHSFPTFAHAPLTSIPYRLPTPPRVEPYSYSSFPSGNGVELGKVGQSPPSIPWDEIPLSLPDSQSLSGLTKNRPRFVDKPNVPPMPVPLDAYEVESSGNAKNEVSTP